jgi:hypothetical protein
MSRGDANRFSAAGPLDLAAGGSVADDPATVAEEIGLAALEMATRAHAAGLTKIGFLLEVVALEAGAEAATRQWPVDIALE